MRGYLFDENLPEALADALHARNDTIPVHWIGDGIAPPKGAPDPEILKWMEEHQFVLVTNNRGSMPIHLANYLSAGRHLPGIMQVPEEYTIGSLAEHLELRFGASLIGELNDLITHIHLD